MFKRLKVSKKEDKLIMEIIDSDCTSEDRELIDCRWLDYVTVYINKTRYCLIVDDNSLLKANPQLMAQSVNYQELRIYNSFLIYKVNKNGYDFVNIGAKDIVSIKQRIDPKLNILLLDSKRKG